MLNSIQHLSEPSEILQRVQDERRGGSSFYERLRPALAAVVVAALSLTGCEAGEPYVPQARGQIGEVLVVTDSATWQGPVGEALREELGALVGTLNPVGGEPAFQVRQQPLQAQFLNNIKMQRSVVFAAPLSDTSNTADFIRARLGEGTEDAIGGQAPGAGIVAREDLWARGQMVYYATDTSPERLVDAIRARGEAMRADFNRVALANTELEMYDRGRQVGIEDTLARTNGFAVNVQHDYFIATDTTFAPAPDTPFAVGDEAHIVWLRRVLVELERNLLVYYLDGVSPAEAEALLDSTAIVAQLDAVTSRFLRGVRDDSAFVYTEPRISVDIEPTTIAGNEAFEVRGLWRMDRFIQGGPFVAYAFYEPTQSRYYLLYGFVLAPGKDKRRLIRQLEVMARTFRVEDYTAAGDATAFRFDHHAGTAHHGSG